MSFKNRFASLNHPDRIWAISAINGQLQNLRTIHDAIGNKFRAGDSIVYTGNYLCGQNAYPLETLDEILAFPTYLGMDAPIVYLRGIQEELFSKMLQLQFAQNPPQVVEWMSRNHPEMNALLHAFGCSFDELSRISREGILSMTRWSADIKSRLRARPEYEDFFTNLRRAAFTEDSNIDVRGSNDNNLLFVHAGLNPHLPLISQGDSFWWETKNFNDMSARYEPFRTVIRGHDPFGRGVHVGPIAISLDGGCGTSGGKLVCARLSAAGRVEEMIAA